MRWRFPDRVDRKSTRLNSSHLVISYAVFCLKKKKICVKFGSSVSSWFLFGGMRAMTRTRLLCSCFITASAHSALNTPAIFFFFNDTATTEIYTLSLHDALPI